MSKRIFFAIVSIFVATVVALSGCEKQPRTRSDDDDGSPSDPPPHCLSGGCETDVDCAPLGGYRCNTALNPPMCEQLYCGAANTLCSSDELCEAGLQCYNQVCNPCQLCGDLCEVDFNTDPNHCGGCDQPVPAGQDCVNGAPGCAAGKTMCDGICLDLSSDPANCGSCGNALTPGVSCEDGMPGCTLPESYCGGTCKDLSTDTYNCGECGFVCPPSTASGACTGIGPDAGCIDGGCVAYRFSDQQVTCQSICAVYELDCHWIPTWLYGPIGSDCISYGSTGDTTITCGAVPPATWGNEPFYGVFCRCLTP